MSYKRYGLRLNRRSFCYGDDDHAGQHAAGLLIEQLRYVGVIDNREGENEFMITARAAGDSERWARVNCDRMASFGVKAELVSRGYLGGWKAEDQDE